MSQNLLELARFFTSLSLMAFGGGKVVLPAIQAEVVKMNWMSSVEFLHLYAIGQAAPGPAMLIVLLVGYKAAGLLGALVAAFCMFAPTCLLMVLLTRAWDKLAASPWHDAVEEALAPITIGLILASAWILYVDAVSDTVTFLIFALSTAVMLRTKVSTLTIVAVSGLVGWLVYGLRG